MSIAARLFVIILALLMSVMPLAAAETGEPVLIIVDGSGSMWGKMEGDQNAKFYAVRDLLRERLLTAPPQSRVGLGSFGHRRKGDCSDVEIITPIEAGGSEGAIAALDQLNPKGKGPLTAAIRDGAKSIGTGSDGHIILVHDNADNCSQDVCAAAADIAKSNPALKIHVLSLGLPKAERDRMQCLAGTTKGLQFNAANEADIAHALTSIFEAAGLDPAAAPPPPVIAIAPAPVAKGPPGLRLSASLSQQDGPIDAPIEWRISKADTAPDMPPLVERKSREINENVDPGRYTVAVKHGLVQRTLQIDVDDDGPTVKRFVLDGGRLDVVATASGQGDKLNAPVMTISTLSEDGASTASVLWLGREANAGLIVPAGKYIVEVADGHARAKQMVEIAPGASSRVNLVLDTGLLELSASAFNGGPALDRVLYLVFADDPSAPQGRREVARSTAPVAAFTLQAGTYYITTRYGASEHREQVALSSGDVVKRTIVLDVGKLTVKIGLSNTAVASAGREFVTRIYEDSGDKRLVGQSTATAPSFVLGAGRYRVESQLGMSNIRTARTVDLAAGGDINTDLKLEAASISLEGISGAAAQAALRDSTGRVVWRSRAGDGFKTVVAPGSYVVQAESGSSEVKKQISIKGGDRLTIDMTPP